MSVSESLFLAAAVFGSAGLAVGAGLLPGHPTLRRNFVAGMLLLTLQTLNSFSLAAGFRSGPVAELLWRGTFLMSVGAGLIWGLFLLRLVAMHHALAPSVRRVAIASAAAVVLVTASTLLLFDPFLDGTPPPDGRPLSTSGLMLSITELLLVAGVLAAVEPPFRSARSDTRWRVKYLLLGLCVIFGTRLYFLTYTVLFGRIRLAHLIAQAATLPVAEILILVSLLRGALAETRLKTSHALLGRSVILITVGLYLSGAGASGWLLSKLEVPELIFWAVLGLLLTAVVASVFLLSEDLRWRCRQIVARHLYPQKYDYRDQWLCFTRKLGTPATLSEISERVLESIAVPLGATRGALYLLSATDPGLYRLAATLGSANWPSVIDSSGTVPWRPIQPQLAESTEDAFLSRHALAPPLLVVPLAWQGAPVGLLLLGLRRDGASYDAEDLTFVSTAAQQAASAVVSLSLAESAARNRELQALHRLTAVIMHDLKSSLSALALLTRNAESRLSDPEFQRDAIRTLGRTVDRMSRLLGRLSPAALSVGEVRTHVDLRTIVERVAKDVSQDNCLEVVQILEPVPEILGDPDALERVVRALVDNALDAMERNGTLTLRTAWQPPWVECTVSDTGCGMTRQFIQESLFQPFRSTKKDGWGLGLYHTYEVITSHHGRIEVFSEPGKGTAITLRFPEASPNPKLTS